MTDLDTIGGSNMTAQEQLLSNPVVLEKSEKITAALNHAERTIQDIIDEMTPDQRDLMDIVVGAAVDNVDLSGDDELVQLYRDMSTEHKYLIDFVVGGLLAEDSVLNHSEVDDFLEHFGVKGMKWGVRKDDSSGSNRLSKSELNTKEGRKAARAAVKGGSATLGEAHLAALKSKGHRVTNALLGDKKYWKTTAITFGLTATSVAASLLVPALLPASVLSAIGGAAGGTAGVAGGHVIVNGSITTTAAIGQQILMGAGLAATQIGSTVASTSALVTNTARAIRGNARVDKSFEAIGKMHMARQTAGNKRVTDILTKQGGLRKKDLTHEDETIVSEFLEHIGVKGMKWGVRKGHLGYVGMEPGAKGGTITAPGVKPASMSEQAKVAKGTIHVRQSLLAKDGPLLRSGGELDTINAKYRASEGTLKEPKTMTAYNAEISSTMTRIARQSAPKGADARVFIQGDSMFLMVGNKATLDQFVEDTMKHSDDMDYVTLKVIRDDDGFIIGFEENVKHSESLDAFLEHHGIKGMKWGVRRSDAELGRVARLKNKILGRNKSSEDDDDSDSSSSSGGGTSGGGTSSAASVTKGSADHERFMTALGKTPEEMSDAELREVTNRAQALQNYQRMFTPQGQTQKSELELRVAEMNLQKQYRDLDATLNPPQKSTLTKLVDRAQQTFGVYNTIDKALGGDLSKYVSRRLGTEPPPSAADQAKLRSALAKATADEAKAKAALSSAHRSVQTDTIFNLEEASLKKEILRGDLPSQAGGYVGAGKRARPGSFNDKGNFVPSAQPYGGGKRRLFSAPAPAPTLATSTAPKKPKTLMELVDEMNRVSATRSQRGKHRK